MKPRETIELRIYRSEDGRYHVASDTIKRIGTVRAGSLRRALAAMADKIEMERR